MSRVEGFIMEALGGSRKRPAHTSGIGATLLLPASVTLEYGDVVKDVHFLLKMGDGGSVPAATARSICLTHMGNAQQLEGETRRVQRIIEQALEQHKGLLAAPTQPTLVKIELRVALGHLQCVFVDELLWDLSAPRSACEAYATTVCADLRLGWLACGIIQRRLKDAVDEEAKKLAEGRAQVVPTGDFHTAVRRGFPRLQHLTLEQQQALQKHKAKRAAAAAAEGQSPAMEAAAVAAGGQGSIQSPPSAVEDGGQASGSAQQAQQAAATAAAFEAAAGGGEPASLPPSAPRADEEGGDDMPDVPEDVT